MSIYTEILQKYWGYNEFRDLQEDIIKSVAQGDDTLGLMPTGGGKSITFQVYSMSVPGICLVITPLISLMQDQVENLNNRGIKALAINSSLSSGEVKRAFDAATWGNYKFLYISPERISSSYFQERLSQLNVNLITIDEAHCISQWGYDFRPSYLGIRLLREMLPHIKVLALTATATPLVVKDIQTQLLFKKENVYQKSFYRDNLIYIVRNREDKMQYLIQSINKIEGTGIVYSRSRKQTREIAEYLLSQGISADYYHAGLSSETRNKKQEDWKHGKTRIIVATSAFGMGIDKADVRFVMHIAPPESLEAYFQEAGRAGRDGKRAYALLIASNSDKTTLKTSISKQFPNKDFIIQIYDMIGSYFQIATGNGLGIKKDFDVEDFCKTFGFSKDNVFNSLKILQRQGLIEFSQSSMMPAKINFKIKRDELYDFNTPNPKLEEFIRVLLRYDGGFFSTYVPINEEELAKQAGLNKQQVIQFLSYLNSLKILHYIPRRTTPYITYIRDRLEARLVKISNINYEDRKEDYKNRIDATLDYVFGDLECRSVKLLKYFGEKKASACGKCDVCVDKLKGKFAINKLSVEIISEEVKSKLEKGAMSFSQLQEKIIAREEILTQVIRLMISENIIRYCVNDKLELC